jgi:ornithine carbamoyltransferase
VIGVGEPDETSPAYRGLIKDGDHTAEQVLATLDLADRLKIARRAGSETPRLTGKNVALVFEKPSTRTRSAFEVALRDQGGAAVYFDSTSSHMGQGESIEDTAKVFGRLFDGVGFRGFAHHDVEQLAEFAGIPVWNGLTDMWHPTQALADLMTMREFTGRPFGDISVCFVGDASDNVARSLLVTGALVGMDVRIAAPAGYQPREETISAARHAAKGRAGRVTITDDVDAAVHGVDFLYTDVWLSMGEKESLWDQRITDLRDFRVDGGMVAATRNPAVRFLHCLPSFHDDSTSVGRTVKEKYGLNGIEVSDDVFRSPASIVFDQAENRMHSIKAMMLESYFPSDGETL